MSVRLSVACAAVLSLVACNNGAGSQIALRVDVEMAGPRCANGGVAVQTGFDVNSNQKLDDAEVIAEQTKYVCNGAPGTGGTEGPAGPGGAPGPAGDAGVSGLNALSVVTAEPAGTNCRYGGARVDVGVDTDANGTLATGEITSTRYICDRASVDSVYFGDITLRTAADLALLDGIQTISGSLTIESVPGGVLTLPDLKVVGYQISLASHDGGAQLAPAALTAVNLPALQRAGDLSLRFSADLVSFSAPRLERLNTLDVSYNEVLTGLTLSKLASVGDFYLWNNAVLAALNLPVLERATAFQVGIHPLLTTLTAPLLVEATSYFGVANNPALPACAGYRLFARLAAPPPSYSLDNNDETATCTAAEICRAPVTVSGVANPIVVCVRPLSFAAARTNCTALGTGAALAWVTSDAEWTALSGAVDSRALPSGGWIGYSDQAVEGTWVAVGGFTGYSPTGLASFWAPGEPSDTNSSQNAMRLDFQGQAADEDGTVGYPFLCRVP